MAKQKGAHLSDKNQSSSYKTQSRYTKNKRAALERHLKKCPNDAQAQAALKNISESSIRKAPKSYVWKQRARKYAQQLASLGYNGHIALGGREEQIRKSDVIGFGAEQILDMTEKQRNVELGRVPSPSDKKPKGKGKKAKR